MRSQSPPPGKTLGLSLQLSLWLGAAGLGLIAITSAGVDTVEMRLFGEMIKAREMIRIARQARILSLDQETGLRGYMISGKVISLAPAVTADSEIGPKLDSLLQLSKDNASQHDRATNIRMSLARWQRGFVVPEMAAIADRKSQSAGNRGLAGKELFDAVRAAFDSFIREEELRYRALVKSHASAGHFGLALILLEIAAVFAMMFNLNRRSVGEARRLVEQQEQLEEQATELEHQTDQLQQQAVQLEEQTEEAQRTLDSLAASNRDLGFTVAELQIAQRTVAEGSEARERTQVLLDSVLEASPVGFGMFDRDFRYTVVNEAMAGLSGMPIETLRGKRPRDLITPESAAVVEELIQKVFSTEEAVFNVPLRGSLASDPERERHWLISYFPVGKKTAPLVGVGIVATETTDRKRLEEQLLQSQKMEAVGRLAGGVAHDFNNMLTAIKSYSELLLEEIDPQSTQHGDVIEISKAADRATALTRQLLAFSRQQVMRPQVIDLNASVLDTIGLLRRLVGASVEIRPRLDEKLGSVFADRAEIERVIVNLAINARDAMPAGGKLTIETSNVTLDELCVAGDQLLISGPYVMLAVSDTGHGMTADVRDRLFEPFFTTKGAGKGTGLGLSSAYGIVSQSEGHIVVDTEPGRGTRFSIYLPRVEVGAQEATSTAVMESPSLGETILLVEDDDHVRIVAARILRREGYNVLEASNGREALATFEKAPSDIDLIVTDIVMPEMDGAELATRIRLARPDVRIMFTSGYTEDPSIRKTIHQAGAAFLEKPFKLEALLAKTRDLLATQPA